MAVNAAALVVGNATVTVGTDIGAIKDGITITPTFTVFNVDIEQGLMPSRFWYTDKKFQLEFTMCEPTLENVKIGWDVPNAIGAGPPRTLSFGTVAAADFVPTNRVIAVTSFTPAPTSGTPTRTVTFHKAILETPGPTVFSKRQETNIKSTWNCAYDTTLARVGQFSDVMT